MKKLNFTSFIYRFISSILFFNIVNLVVNNFNYGLEFMQDLGVFEIIFAIISIFVVLSILNYFIKNKYTDYILTMIFLFICSLGWLKDDNIFFLIIISSLLLLLYHFKPNDLNIRFKKINNLFFVVIIVFGILMFLHISIVGILRYKTFSSPNFDLGIPGQMFYYLKKTGLPLSTCERDALINHLIIHFSPIYYLLVPIYFIFSHVTLFPIVSALLISSGVIPIYLLCKNHKLSKLIIMIICLIFCTYAGAICSTYFDFHENHFLIPLLLWLFYFYEKKNTIGILIFSILTLLVKEDAALYLVIFSIFMIFDKNKKYGIPLLVISLLYFIIVTYYLKTFGNGIMVDRYGNLVFNDRSMGGIIKTIILNPGYFLKQLVTSTDGNISKIKYILQLLLPLGFIPLYSKEKKNYILLIPLLLTTMMVYQYGYNINFHYSCGIIAFLFYLFIKNIKELKISNYLLICLIIGILTYRTYAFPYLQDKVKYYVKNKSELIMIEEILKTVPSDASVSASAFMVPHLINRDYIYEIYYHGDIPDIDYVVLDTSDTEYINHYKNYIDMGYSKYNEIANKVIILKK